MKAGTIIRGAYWILLAWGLLAGAKAAAWVNPGFETGTSAGWTFSNSATVPGVTLNPPQEQVVASGAAPLTNGQLNMVHSGSYAGALFSGDGDLYHGDWSQISQSDTVPAGTSCLSGYFAAVLSGYHYVNNLVYADEPYDSDAYVLFQITVNSTLIYSQRFSWYDNANQLIDPGAPYDVTITAYSGGVPFIENDVNNILYNGPWKYLPWTQYYFDMSPYVGQTATIVYTAYSCYGYEHFSYGYLDDVAWIACPPSPTPSPTFTISPTATQTPTASPSFTVTPSASVTPSFTASPTFSDSPTPSPSATATASFTFSPTVTQTPSATPSFTDSPTLTPTPTVTPTPTITPSRTPTPPPFLLSPHYPSPDPAGPAGVYLPYTITDPAFVDMHVYDVAGELVRAWGSDPQFQQAGTYERFWDEHNSSGAVVGSGVYLVRIHARSTMGEHEVWEKCSVVR